MSVCLAKMRSTSVFMAFRPGTPHGTNSFFVY
jgi:hypothetical protein